VSLTHRLNALERNHRPVTDVTEVTEETRRRIRELAEHDLRCRSGEEYGRHPLWEIDDGGTVYAAHDGKEITTTLQTAGELFYWMHVEWGYPECVHDEDERAFYSRASGELILSRDYFNLPAMGRAERGELQRRLGEG
jgi:hypothetical protein